MANNPRFAPGMKVGSTFINNVVITTPLLVDCVLPGTVLDGSLRQEYAGTAPALSGHLRRRGG